jgi:hypothetical protein
VYLATAAVPAPVDAATDRVPLPLAGIATRAFPAEVPYDSEMLRFFGDLARLYDLPYRREEFATLRRSTFTDMVAGILAELGDDPVGLVVLAHATPDGEPNWPACFLTSVLPGEPLGFAVADQGVLAPFTALRIASSYIRADAVRRAVVLVLDQTTMLRVPSAEPTRVPAENRVVALVFDERGTVGELSVHMGRSTGTPAPGRRVVVGGSLPPGLVCTRIWTELADHLDRWRGDGTREVVLTDHDPHLDLAAEAVLRLGIRS